ncbi:hypothetical protein PUR33_14160 [Streptomyces sp. BE282]|uniref:hypothetical protein n=1 Tax=Streptomyces TaxID=1883 RepID=UPI002E76FA40|nr:hypothetical protein [Streptomyces sp. BE282]MEE1730252.1 hypothetical protein [Streptomyces sp. BE282]WTF68014.1 hypothetical protein OH770_04945 [Streptomyces microflavus]
MARGSGPYWYRGWMVPSGRYAELEKALAVRLGPVREAVRRLGPRWGTTDPAPRVADDGGRGRPGQRVARGAGAEALFAAPAAAGARA